MKPQKQLTILCLTFGLLSFSAVSIAGDACSKLEAVEMNQRWVADNFDAFLMMIEDCMNESNAESGGTPTPSGPPETQPITDTRDDTTDAEMRGCDEREPPGR